MTAPGFQLDDDVLVNGGPLRAGAGAFPSDPAGAALWNRQVLTTGRLDAVVLTGAADFTAAHVAAERAAARLGIGAIGVAVCAAGADAAVVTHDGWTVAALLGGPTAVLTTDAVADAEALRVALAPVGAVGEILLLASGESGFTPAPGELTGAVTELCGRA